MTLVLVFVLGHSHAHSHEESGPEEAWDEIFLCKQCKHPLAHQKKVLGYVSPGATGTYNVTINGELMEVQKLVNPHGFHFDVITMTESWSKSANNEKQLSNTWFPGYTWNIQVCGGCRGHIGWKFESVELHVGKNVWPPDTFYGLIYDRLEAVESLERKINLTMTGKAWRDA